MSEIDATTGNEPIETPNPFPDLGLDIAAVKEPEPEAPETEPEPIEDKWSKPLQKMQQNFANHQKAMDQKFNDLMDVMKGIAERPATSAAQKKSDYEEAMELLDSDQGKELETLNPGLTKVLRAALKARENGGSVKALQEKIDKLEKLSDKREVEEFWQPYPKEAREFVESEEKRLVSELGLKGEALRGALKLVLNTYLSEASKTAKAAASPSRAPAQPKPGTVIPSNTGGRPASKIDYKKVVESGVGGNLLGLPINFT